MSSLAGTGSHPSAGMAPDKLGPRGPFIRGITPFIRGAGNMEFCQGTAHQCGICLPLLMVCVFSSHSEQCLQHWNCCVCSAWNVLPRNGSFCHFPSLILLFSPHPRRRVSISSHQRGQKSFYKVEFFLPQYSSPTFSWSPQSPDIKLSQEELPKIPE